MKRPTVFLGLGTLLLSAEIFAFGQQAPVESGPAISVVVTAEPKRGKAIPPLEVEDLVVKQGREKLHVAALEPVSGARLQLLLMIDDSAAESFNTEIRSLKDFVMAQPANAEVAVGYMHNGMTQMASDFTPDHAAAAKAIRVALG